MFAIPFDYLATCELPSVESVIYSKAFSYCGRLCLGFPYKIEELRRTLPTFNFYQTAIKENERKREKCGQRKIFVLLQPQRGLVVQWIEWKFPKL